MQNLPSITRELNHLKPRCAGIVYPVTAPAIRKHVRSFFDGPQAAPWSEENHSAPLSGIITPHIDLRVSPHAYSWAFHRWLEAKPAEVYLILGVGHRAHQEWSIDARPYHTPLGKALTDSDAIQCLLQETDYPLDQDGQAHEGEHSIEFPVILLQALHQLRGATDFRFIPLLCGGLFEEVRSGKAPDSGSVLHQLAAVIQKFRKQYGSSLQIIVSIDGCHIGPRFGHSFEVNPNILDGTRKWEKVLWSKVESCDFDGFLNHLHRDQNARCLGGHIQQRLVLIILRDRRNGLVAFRAGQFRIVRATAAPIGSRTIPT